MAVTTSTSRDVGLGRAFISYVFGLYHFLACCGAFISPLVILFIFRFSPNFIFVSTVVGVYLEGVLG